MPIYEYECVSPKCKRQTESTRRIDERHNTPKCPDCGADTLLKTSAPAFTVLGGTPRFH